MVARLISTEPCGWVRADDGEEDRLVDEASQGLELLARHYAVPHRPLGPEDLEAMASAASLLWTANMGGTREPCVVWPLKQLWTDTGHLDRVVELLTDYQDCAEGAEERFLVAHYLVDTYALMEADREAYEHHVRTLDVLGKDVQPWQLLWSLSDATMMASWERSGHIAEWLERTQKLYETIQPVDAGSKLSIAYYLRTLAAIRRKQGDAAGALGCAERLLELYRGDESPDALRLTGDALCELIGLYREVGDQAARREVVGRALEVPSRLDRLRLTVATRQGFDSPVLADWYWQAGGTVCHNLGCALMWSGEPESAVGLLERALHYRDDPLTRFFYAAVLAALGRRRESLEHLRRSIRDPRSSLVHRTRKRSRSQEAFSSVHDDPEFLAVVHGGARRYQEVGQAWKQTAPSSISKSGHSCHRGLWPLPARARGPVRSHPS